MKSEAEKKITVMPISSPLGDRGGQNKSPPTLGDSL